MSKHFISTYAENNKIKAHSLSESAISKLMNYLYPGNVRELRSVLELACVMADQDIIEDKDIIFNNVGNIMNLVKNDMSLKEINGKIIEQLLNENNGNIKKVADQLKIGKSTIYRLLKYDQLNKPYNQKIS